MTTTTLSDQVRPAERLGYGLFDADNHYYEPRDAFTMFIEPAFRDHVIRAVRDEEGHDQLVCDGLRYFWAPPMFDRVAPPGALREMMRSFGNGGDFWGVADIEMAPEFMDRDARLALMDRQGIEGSFIFPGIAIGIEHWLKDRTDILMANIRAFNRWLEATWGFAYQDRLFAAPLVSLLDADVAVSELEWALSAGARVILMRPAPVNGRSPADPAFDGFWARVNEARVPVAFHIADSGYNEIMGPHWGEESNPSSHAQSAFQWANCMGDRPIMDTLSALVFGNLFGRFPDVQVVSVENGSLWVPYLLKNMDKKKNMGRFGPWIGGYVKGRPSEIFREHVYVAPFHEDDMEALLAVLGPERVLLGSDYPHPEGLANPADFVDLLPGSLSPEEVRLIARDNGRSLVGL